MPVALAPTPSLAARRGFVTLGAEAWAQIRSEYLAGATAAQIKAKWGCSIVSIYDHASKGGWTKRSLGQAVSATVLDEVRAEREARAARACQPLPEASPLLAAGVLLRQAAASALMGESGAAFEGLKLAESLARCARLLSEAEHGVGAAREALLLEARQGLEDDADYRPVGWREEDEALDAAVLAGLARIRLRRGRSPPQRLPLWFMLDGEPTLRPLAEALGLVTEGRGWVECPDFDAAMGRARAAGWGEAVDRALSEPVPLALCTWLDAEEKAAVMAREAQAAGTAEVAAVTAVAATSPLRWPGYEPPPELEPEPSIEGLCEGDDPWPKMRRPRAAGLSEPHVALS